MTYRNTTDSYGAIAKAFHWGIALLVIAMLGAGLYMTTLDPSPKMFQIYALHKSVGIAILTLAVLRVLWRFSNPHPYALSNHLAWEKLLARAIHFLLYVSLFLMPLTGWLMSSAKGFSVSVFGWFTLPDFIKPNDALAHLLGDIHQYAAYTLIAMIGLHFAGAIKHHIIDRDATLRRMLPRFFNERE